VIVASPGKYAYIKEAAQQKIEKTISNGEIDILQGILNGIEPIAFPIAYKNLRSNEDRIKWHRHQ
jgi:hypothetical protein